MNNMKSLKDDDKVNKSSIRDVTTALAEELRAARRRQQLSQAELAGKLGLRQRQISDLERSAVDARLSTIQNVARGLDLELMLVPRHLISAVEALQRANTEDDRRPLYTLDEDEERP
jgi:transcriptional regulator with XRE-family HTH domain